MQEALFDSLAHQVRAGVSDLLSGLPGSQSHFASEIRMFATGKNDTGVVTMNLQCHCGQFLMQLCSHLPLILEPNSDVAAEMVAHIRVEAMLACKEHLETVAN